MSDSEIPQEQETQPAQEPQDFSPGHESKKRKIPRIPMKQAAGFAAVAILFFAVGFLLPKGATTTGMSIGPVLTSQEAGVKAVEYINSYLLQPGYTASLISSNDSNGIYSISINITSSQGSTIYPSYVTKDGNLLFVSAVDLSVNPETDTTTQQETQTVPKTDEPNVKMFVMAYCPYGQQAEAGLGPAIEAINMNNIAFEPHFVIYSNYGDGGPNYCFDNESLYCSMHGINELREGVRQMVIWKYYPEKWWAYVDKVNAETSTSDIESKWKAIATSVGLDADHVQDYFDSEALDLLAAESALNDQYGVRGSPTIFINDVQYSGGRAPEDFKAGICGAFNTPPSGCNETLSAAGSTASGGCG
jgi:glutaredoxin